MPVASCACTRGADVPHVRRDFSPVVAAQALLEHGVAVAAVLAYLQRTWGLSEVDGRAAIAAGRLLIGRDVRYDAERRAAVVDDLSARTSTPDVDVAGADVDVVVLPAFARA